MKRLPSRTWASPVMGMLAAAAATGIALVAHAAPAIELLRPDATPAVGQPYTFECEIRWSEDDGPWLVQPPNLAPLDWGTLEAKRWTAYTENGEHVLRQTMALVPVEAGAFEVPVIEFPYTDPEANHPAGTQTPQSPNAPKALSTLRTPPFPVEVKPHTTPSWVSAGLPLLLVTGALLIAGWYIVRRRRQWTPVPVGASASGTDPSWLAAAKRHRVDGDAYGFYRVLAETAAADPSLQERMRQSAEAVGYKGEQVTPAQMDQDLRAVQRVVESGDERNSE